MEGREVCALLSMVLVELKLGLVGVLAGKATANLLSLRLQSG